MCLCGGVVVAPTSRHTFDCSKSAVPSDNLVCPFKLAVMLIMAAI